jgi:hypothetical protein
LREINFPLPPTPVGKTQKDNKMPVTPFKHTMIMAAVGKGYGDGRMMEFKDDPSEANADEILKYARKGLMELVATYGKKAKSKEQKKGAATAAKITAKSSKIKIFPVKFKDKIIGSVWRTKNGWVGQSDILGISGNSEDRADVESQVIDEAKSKIPKKVAAKKPKKEEKKKDKYLEGISKRNK